MPSLIVLSSLVLTMTAIAGAQVAERPQPPRMPHARAGKADCLSCHAPGANEHITSTPAAHRFGNPACAACHRLAEQLPPSPAHAIDEAHTTCLTCHVADSPTGAKVPPASHAAYHATICQLCHVAAEGG